MIIGRIAGQYAKPRSNDGEMHNGEKIEIYRGDIINDYDPNGDRTANPCRILEAYYNSVTTMYVLYLTLRNYIKDWNTHGDKSSNYYLSKYKTDKNNTFTSELYENYNNINDNKGKYSIENNRVYTAHEGLLLNYEECFVKKCDDGKYYNQSAHLLWIGKITNKNK